MATVYLPKTLLQAVKYFAVPENCLSYLVSRRWPNGVTCPTCGSAGVYFDKTRMGWICKTKHPNRKFSLKTGTIFEDSPLGLDKWLPAVWMISGAKNGISSHELARAVGVTQKSAWFMLHRIRLAMQDRTTGGKLGGDVEADETFIGGKARNMHVGKRKRVLKGKTGVSGKVAVMGLLERTTVERLSKVRARVIANIRKPGIHAEIRQNVETGSNLHTDAFHSYLGLEQEYVHNVIDHAECYVNGNVHTNGLENFWSLLKRSIKGTYVSIELFRYIDEQAFRFNERNGTDADRFEASIDGIVGRRVMYKDLIAETDRERP